jgi:transcriptional regulator GlxA family with amidase domain
VASLSAPRFHAFFRQFMGRSPMDHLKHLRLSEACRLLATGDEPLRVVAEKTGFCNEFHLGRDFKRVFGKPPGVWRRDYDRNLA